MCAARRTKESLVSLPIAHATAWDVEGAMKTRGVANAQGSTQENLANSGLARIIVEMEESATGTVVAASVKMGIPETGVGKQLGVLLQ